MENPSDAVLVEISYALVVGGGDTSLTTNVRVYGEENSKYTLQLPEFGIYQIGAVAVDNYGKRSEKVMILGTPAEKDAIDPDIIAEYKLPIADPLCYTMKVNTMHMVLVLTASKCISLKI